MNRADENALGTRVKFLQSVRLFEQLSDPALLEVARRCRLRRVERGEFVFLEGNRARAVQVLFEGQVKIVRETEDGREVIIRIIQPGDLFGGAGGWGREVYPATAITLEDSSILELPSDDFAALMGDYPDFALALVRELGARLREAEGRIQELQTERVERRIARTILRLANKTGTRTARGIEIGVPLSRQDLADLCGTTLSTASRTLSAWHRKGIIIAGRERVTIRQAHRLVGIAEDFAVDEERPSPPTPSPNSGRGG
jgi:CRP-like cAMP-binding protein